MSNSILLNVFSNILKIQELILKYIKKLFNVLVWKKVYGKEEEQEQELSGRHRKLI